MVHGLEVFRQYFSGHEGKYVLIGGAACSLLMGEQGMRFRATRDLDVVLIMEAVDRSFLETFRTFIQDGGYGHNRKGTEQSQYYRFSKPVNQRFPLMVELFCRKPGTVDLDPDALLTPVVTDESSICLSAILLDDAYYDMLHDGSVQIDGFSVLNLESVMTFKMKAWLDLKSRKERGEQVDSRDVKKHRNDVLRLSTILDPQTRWPLPEEVSQDVRAFVGAVAAESVDLPSLGIHTQQMPELLGRIRRLYGI